MPLVIKLDEEKGASITKEFKLYLDKNLIKRSSWYKYLVIL